MIWSNPIFGASTLEITLAVIVIVPLFSRADFGTRIVSIRESAKVHKA